MTKHSGFEAIGSIDFASDANASIANIRIASSFASGSSTGGIQEAIDALPSTGGIVYIPPGDYTLATYVNINKNNIALIGGGMDTVLTRSSNGHIFYSYGTEFGHTDNIKIADMRLVGDLANDAQHGISFRYARFCTFENLELYHMGLDGIWLGEAAWDCNVERVRVLSCGAIGIFTYNGDFINYTDCYTTDTAGVAGMQFKCCRNSTMRGCRSRNAANSGCMISAAAASPQSYQNNVIGCIVVNPNDGGAEAARAGIYIHGAAGLPQFGTSVNGNQVYSASNYGMRLTYLERCTIGGNTVIDTSGARAYHLNLGDRIAFSDNIGDGATGDVLYLDDMTRVQIEGGSLTGGGGWGVRSVNASDRVILMGVDLAGNTAGPYTLVGANNEIGHNITS